LSVFHKNYLHFFEVKVIVMVLKAAVTELTLRLYSCGETPQDKTPVCTHPLIWKDSGNCLRGIAESDWEHMTYVSFNFGSFSLVNVEGT